MRFQSCAGMPAYENSSHAADLMALVNVETGGPVITGVDKSSRWYRRSPEDTLPDLFLDWERSGLIETVWSPKTEIVHAPYGHGARAITDRRDCYSPMVRQFRDPPCFPPSRLRISRRASRDVWV